MKKKFIEPSLNLKKFNRDVLTDVSGAAPATNENTAVDELKESGIKEETTVTIYM